jgi:hypothetical protein
VGDGVLCKRSRLSQLNLGTYKGYKSGRVARSKTWALRVLQTAAEVSASAKPSPASIVRERLSAGRTCRFRLFILLPHDNTNNHPPLLQTN